MTLPEDDGASGDLGLRAGRVSSAECAVLMKTEMARWTKVIRDAGIKAQ